MISLTNLDKYHVGRQFFFLTLIYMVSAAFTHGNFSLVQIIGFMNLFFLSPAVVTL